MKLPTAVKYLLIANIALFIIDQLLIMKHVELADSLALFFIGNPRFMPHQFITYMFMHGSFMHLFFNMFALWMFGRIMEQVWGAKKFLYYYFICGIGAAVTQEVGQVLGWIPLNACTLGASGAVFGILLAFGLTFPNEKIFIIPIPFPIKAKYFVFFYAAVEVFEFLAIKDGVAHLAHLGGMLFGALLIFYWKKNKDKDINNWKRSNTSSRQQSGKAGNIFGWGTSTASQTQRNINKNYDAAGREKKSDMEYNSRKKAESEAIDLILDKIRKSGWDSLSDEEKRKLFEASKNK